MSQHPPATSDGAAPRGAERAPAPAVPGAAVLAFAERTCGPLDSIDDVSWPRPESQVWRLSARTGQVAFLKIHQNAHFHAREVSGLNGPARALAEHAPRLLGDDPDLRAVVVTEVPGRLLKHLLLTRTDAAIAYQRLGTLVRAFHDAAPPVSGPDPNSYRAKLDRHLDAARPYLGPGDDDLVRALADHLDHLPPLDHVPTIGDLAERNVLLTEDLTVGLVDFERSELGPAVRDFVRLADEWAHRPDLETAFMTGYGRTLTPAETELLPVLEALDAISGIAWGSAEGGRDRHLVGRGQRTLARLRASIPTP